MMAQLAGGVATLVAGAPRAARTVAMLTVLADRARALRRFKDTQGRDAPHIGQAPKYGREASPGQDTSNTARGFAYRRGHQH